MSKRMLLLSFWCWVFVLFSSATLADAAERRFGEGVDAVSAALSRSLGSPAASNGTLVVNGARFEFETRRTVEPKNEALSLFEDALPKSTRCLRTGSAKRPMSVCLSPLAPLGLSELERVIATRDFTSLGPLNAAIASETHGGTSLLLLRTPHLPVTELLHPTEALSPRTRDSVLTGLSRKEPLLVVATTDERRTEPLLVVARKPLFDAEDGPKPRVLRRKAGEPPWLTLRARSGLFVAARLPD